MAEVFKLVKRTATSLGSMIVLPDSPYFQRYVPLQDSYPPIGRSFAFATLQDALAYLEPDHPDHLDGGTELWRAEADITNPEPPEISMYAITKMIEAYWDGDLSPFNCIQPPAGTVMCSRIRLLERIDNREFDWGAPRGKEAW